MSTLRMQNEKQGSEDISQSGVKLSSSNSLSHNQFPYDFIINKRDYIFINKCYCLFFAMQQNHTTVCKVLVLYRNTW